MKWMIACIFGLAIAPGLQVGSTAMAPAPFPGDDKRGVDLPKGGPLLQAIQKRLGRPDRVTGSGRMFIHYDLSNGDTLTFVVSGAKVLGTEHKTQQPRGDLLDAIRSRLGKPDRVTGSGRAFIDYDLPNGDTLTLVVSGGRVLGTGHKTKK
jgi:hypothetical protein